MPIDASHPALGFARELFSDDGWEITDALRRDDEAVVVELRRSGMRLLFVVVAQDGAWHRPDLVTRSPQAVPEPRRSVTVPGAALEPAGVQGSGWPGPDGDPPETVWVTINGFAAADVEGITVSTTVDQHAANVMPDGSFLTLVRSRRREQPSIRLHLIAGETLDTSV